MGAEEDILLNFLNAAFYWEQPHSALYLYFPICDMTPPSGLLSTIFTFISGATSVATQYRV